MKLKRNKVYHGSCIDLLPLVPTNSVDMILTDLPYGTTACSWDSIIPLDYMWQQFKRITKEHSPIVLFGVNPFSSMPIASQVHMYRHQWVWYKASAGNFMSAKHAPLKVCEDIIVFSKETPCYYPQMVEMEVERKRGNAVTKKTDFLSGVKSGEFVHSADYDGKVQYPKNLIYYSAQAKECNNGTRVHPTQKPLDLCEYLIKTYTKENELVLDITMGSGSTCVAAKNVNRKYLGFEKEGRFFDIAERRLENTIQVSDPVSLSE